MSGSKKERGITLVALVITVIIMLILAGVALSLITGEEGLFARANHAASLYKDASQKEADRVGQLVNSEYMGGEGSGPTEPVKPDIPEPNITPTYIPETNINPSIYNGGKGVKVEITDNTNSGYQLQYSTDEGLSWYDYIEGETEIYVAEYNGVVLAQLYDKATGTSGASATIAVTNIDTLAPEEFSYTEGEKTENTITISGSTKDTVNIDVSASSEVKYKYAIQSTQTEPTWGNIEETTETEKTFDKVTGTEESLKAGTTYYVYMLAIDEAGNITKAGNNGIGIEIEKAGTLITELAKNKKLKAGDYIEYDAGNWTAEDLEKIRNSEGSPTVTGSKDKPTVQGEFGGFEIGDSRNYYAKGCYTSKTGGWRVWKIDEGTGKVTIIHAGIPEAYYHGYYYYSSSDKVEEIVYSKESINILRNRDCTMYENDYAELNSAHFMMGWELAEWYTTNIPVSKNYTLGHQGDDGFPPEDECSFFYDYKGNFVATSLRPVVGVIDIGDTYCLATAQSESNLFIVKNRTVVANVNILDFFGVRPLVSLKTNILLESDGQTDGEWNQWKITGSAN